MAVLTSLDANLEKDLIATLLAATVMLITVNVLMRYVMNDSLSWGEELTLWIFVWFVWLSVSYAFQRNAHVRITVFRDLLPERGRLMTNIVVDLLVLAFMLVLSWECLDLMRQPFVASQNSVVLGLPIPILYASAPAGALLSSVRIVQHLVATVKALRQTTTGVA